MSFSPKSKLRTEYVDFVQKTLVERYAPRCYVFLWSRLRFRTVMPCLVYQLPPDDALAHQSRLSCTKLRPNPLRYTSPSFRVPTCIGCYASPDTELLLADDSVRIHFLLQTTFCLNISRQTFNYFASLCQSFVILDAPFIDVLRMLFVILVNYSFYPIMMFIEFVFIEIYILGFDIF